MIFAAGEYAGLGVAAGVLGVVFLLIGWRMSRPTRCHHCGDPMPDGPSGYDADRPCCQACCYKRGIPWTW